MSPALTGDGSFMEQQQRSRRRSPQSERLYGLGRHDLASDEGHELELGHVPTSPHRRHYADADEDIEQASDSGSPRHSRREHAAFDSEPNLSPYLPRFPSAVARRETKSNSNSWTDEKDESRSIDAGADSFVMEKPASEISTPAEDPQTFAAPPNGSSNDARSSTTLGSGSVEILRLSR